MRILIVDDDCLIREILRDVLSPIATVIHEAATCEEALELAFAISFDCITLDNQLPDGIGLYILPSLVETGARVLMLSGRAGEAGFARQARERGADLVLAKPFDAHVLPYIIKGLCAQSLS